VIVIQPHTACVNVVTYAPDGSLLASVSEDGWVRVWNPATLHAGEPVWEALGDSAEDDEDFDDAFFAEFGLYLDPDQSGLSHAQFTPDGKRLVTGGWQEHLRCWSVKTGKPLWQVVKPQGFGGVGALVIARDGRHVAFAGGQIGVPERVCVADLKTHEIVRTLKGHRNACGAMAASPEGFATGGADACVRFWTWDGPRCYHELALRGIVRGLAFSPDGSIFAAAGGSVVMVWDMEKPPRGRGRRKPGKVRRFRGHTDQIQTLDFSPDGAQLASAAHDGTVRVWDVASGGEVRAFAPKVGKLHGVAFAPDGLTLAFSSVKGHVGVLDVGG
jgi:WD40 repeat protein